MRIFAIAAALVAAVSFSAERAEAATFSIVGGDSIVLPANFSRDTPQYLALAGGVGSIGDPISVFTTATKAPGNGLVVNGVGRVTFTYLGREAGFQNEFSAFSTTLFDTFTSSVGDASGVFVAGSGALPFTFTSRGFDTVANDGVATTGVRLAFSELFNGGRSVLAFFDDRTSDIDYDDMVVRIDIAAIPLPATAWMFIAGMGGLMLLSRRRALAG